MSKRKRCKKHAEMATLKKVLRINMEKFKYHFLCINIIAMLIAFINASIIASILIFIGSVIIYKGLIDLEEAGRRFILDADFKNTITNTFIKNSERNKEFFAKNIKNIIPVSEFKVEEILNFTLHSGCSQMLITAGGGFYSFGIIMTIYRSTELEKGSLFGIIVFIILALGAIYFERYGYEKK